MGFDAGTAVETLDFDFTTLNPCPDELKNAKGVIPEPDIETLNTFSEGFYGLLRMMRTLNQIERPVNDDDDDEDTEPETVADEGVAADPATVHALIEDWQESLTQSDDSERKELEDALIEWMLLVCHPVLTKEQLRAIPGRVRTAFVAWLTGELITPKGFPSASGPSREVTGG